MRTNGPLLTTDGLDHFLMGRFGEAQDMKLLLSEDDSVYDLNYITEKLAKVAVFQERLSDIQMVLTRTGLEIRKAQLATATLLRFKEKESKASYVYVETPLNEKAFWLENQHTELRGQTAEWAHLMTIVSEVKTAVINRAATMKRLDSDLRLHARIYEAKVAAGATAPSTYKGNSTREIDL